MDGIYFKVEVERDIGWSVPLDVTIPSWLIVGLLVTGFARLIFNIAFGTESPIWLLYPNYAMNLISIFYILKIAKSGFTLERDYNFKLTSSRSHLSRIFE